MGFTRRLLRRLSGKREEWTLHLNVSGDHVLVCGTRRYDVQGGECQLSRAPGAAPQAPPPDAVLVWAGNLTRGFDQLRSQGVARDNVATFRG